MKRLGIALLSAGCGLIVGAAVLYLLAALLETTPWVAQLLAGVLTLVISLGLAFVLSRAAGRLTGNLIATLIAIPLLLGVFLGCGMLWAVLGVVITGG